jgi:HAD superfamily hydrolase (TIGR01549 family)
MQSDAIIFDFDDTLVDFEYWIKHKWLATCNWVEKDLGIKGFDEAFWKAFSQKSIYFHYFAKLVLNRLGYDDKDELHDIISNYFTGVVVDDIMFGGTIELLYALTQSGYRLAVYTNGDRLTHEPRLKNTGISRYMDYIQYKHEYQKPSYKGFVKTAKALGTTIDKCIVVGDDIRDILAPSKLGATTVKICHKTTGYNELIEIVCNELREV